MFFCLVADSAAFWWVHAWTLSSWRSSAQCRGAYHWTPPLPTHLFTPPGIPTETLWGGRACLFAAFPWPYAQRCTVYSDHSSRDTTGSTQSRRATVSGTKWAGSMRCASSTTYPCSGGGGGVRPRFTSSTTQPAVGRGSELCRDPWSWSFSVWAFSLLG